MGVVDLSVCILSWNTRELTLACLRSLQADTPRRPREVIVVDNGSADGSAEAIAREFPEVTLLANPDNRYYSGGNNQAAEVASGRYLCLLNSDTEVPPGALDTLVDWLEAHPDHAGVAPKLRGLDGRVQSTCNRMVGLLDPLLDSTSLGTLPLARRLADHTRMADFDHLDSRDVEQPCTSAFVMRASDFHAIGGFDPALLVYFTDVDLCRRLWARGRKLHYLADVEILHHMGASTERSGRRTILWLRDRNTFYRKHYGLLGGLWTRALVHLYGVELRARITLGPRRGPARKAALRQVADEVRAVLAP
jgi:N-acetylglucosaminyl-diphospho-decaprenol L-rhamnosyltransferase